MDQNGRKIIKSFMLVMQIGISMMVPIFLSAWIGWWLDRWLDTGFFFLLMIFLGVGAAFRNIFVLTKSFYAADLKREQEQLKYMEELKNYSSEHPNEEMGDVMEGKKKRYRENKGETRH